MSQSLILSSDSLETDTDSSNSLSSAIESFSIFNSTRDDRNTRLRGRSFRGLHLSFTRIDDGTTGRNSITRNNGELDLVRMTALRQMGSP
jgi:hypothetical protein